MQYYRNKTIFDWKNFEENDISSIISLHIMKKLKKTISLDIQNVIIRNILDSIGIIIQINSTEISFYDSRYIYKKIKNILICSPYKLKYFAIQKKINNTFVKGSNLEVLKNDFIKFKVYYNNPKIISLLPDSFFQPNIYVLWQYYNTFKKWIYHSKCLSLINLGDDGGNICTILSDLFENIITLFHCVSSYKCALEMIKDNNLSHLNITFNISDIYQFEKQNKDIILFINPGRKGLKGNELKVILNSLNITNIIYMACNYKAFEKDYNILENKFNIIDKITINTMPHTRIQQNLIYLQHN